MYIFPAVRVLGRVREESLGSVIPESRLRAKLVDPNTLSQISSFIPRTPFVGEASVELDAMVSAWNSPLAQLRGPAEIEPAVKSELSPTGLIVPLGIITFRFPFTSKYKEDVPVGGGLEGAVD